MTVDVSSLVTNTGLCGASAGFDGMLDQLKLIEAELSSGIDLDASALQSSLGSSLSKLQSDLRALVPPLPTIETVSLQSELKELLRLPPASTEYLGKLTEITSTFGDALASAGQDISTIITNATSALTTGGDLCSQIPNFESAGTEVVEKATNVLQAQTNSLKEEVSSIGDIDISKEITEIRSKADTAINTALSYWNNPVSVTENAIT